MQFISFYFDRATLYRPNWLAFVTLISLIFLIFSFARVPINPELFLLASVIVFLLIIHELKIYTHVKKEFYCFEKGIKAEGTILQRLTYQNFFWTIAGPDIIYKFETPTEKIITARAPRLMESKTKRLKKGDKIIVYYDPDNPRKCAVLLD